MNQPFPNDVKEIMELNGDYLTCITIDSPIPAYPDTSNWFMKKSLSPYTPNQQLIAKTTKEVDCGITKEELTDIFNS